MRGFLAAALLAALALPARADIVDSGSLVIGQQGIIGGTMTVQGNAFSVGGSTFSVLGGSVSVGGLLKPSAAGIQWVDGTVSTTAISAVAASSTQTFVPSGSSWSNSAWAGCLGSTITLVTSGHPLYVFGSGSIDPNGTWWASSMWVLIDGAFVESYSALKPNIKETAASNGFYMGASFGLLVRNLTAASHSICIGFANSSGNGVLPTDYTIGAFEVL